MKITIKDVAKKANVSVATVSRVINNKGGYSEETEERILRVIEELNYSPNAIARGLVGKRTKTIGLLVPDLTSTLPIELLKGVEKAAHKMGHSVILCNTELGGKKTLDYLRLLDEKQIDGIIYASHELKEDYYRYIKKMNVPLVLLATESNRFPVPFVKVNDRMAVYSAISYLIEKGHRKIAIISGSQQDEIAGVPRIVGYKAAMRDHGLSIKDEWIVETESFFFENGKKGFLQLMNQAPDITAVFAASDDMAIGVLSAANNLGIKVPDDLSVMGYDNLRIAEMVVPTLTTVAQPFEKMGERAVEMIFEMLSTGKNIESFYFPHQIIERQSVKDLTR